MTTQANLQLFKDPLPLPARIYPVPNSILPIKMSPSVTSLHSDLPPTPIWGYTGRFPGPIIEVQRHQRTVVEWKNRLSTLTGAPAPFPMTAVTEVSDTQADAGTSTTDSTRFADLSVYSRYLVTHLHGAKTHPDSDGWTDNGVLPGQSTICTYDNHDRAGLYWFHDHAMGITRFNVYAGLAGLYIVRDAEEDGLHLPSGSYEIPLVLQDRNLETSSTGQLTGRLLHKVVDDTMEFFGPFNVVNGKISPFLEVNRAVYRLRVVNGCNGRTYKLKLLMDADNSPCTEAVLTQIGTDGGLLGAPVVLPNNELILAPGERADLIADFRAVSLKGKKINWVNVAKAPFDATEVTFTNPRTLDNDDAIIKSLRQRNACVMQFKVRNLTNKINNFNMPIVLSASFARLSHQDLPANHGHRLVALVEEDFTDPNTGTTMPMLKMRELVEVNVAGGETIPAGEFSLSLNGKLYRSVASMFYDATTFMIRYGTTEVWKIINLTGDTHPFHVHLVQYQALGRQTIVEPIADFGTTNAIGANNFVLTLTQTSADDSLLDANEKGWKDTIRVNPAEVMSIAATFDGYHGRYMYHCHLLEHEDREMMRPFVVLPEAVIDNMHMSEHHH